MAQRILVVDDSDTVRDVIVSVLKHSGYDIAEAEDGREALDALAREVPDMVITDMAMPRMGGVELIRRMAESHELCRVPIVVVSANIDGMDAKIPGRGQVVAWIEKPFRIKQLIAEVREGLEWTRENCLEGV